MHKNYILIVFALQLLLGPVACGEVLSLFSAPAVEHVSYSYTPAPPTGMVYILVQRAGAVDTEIAQTEYPGSMSGLHRTDMTGGSVQFVLIAVSNDNSRTEQVLRTINPATSISGTARYDETELGASEGTTSSGFDAAANVTVELNAEGIEWGTAVLFGGDGAIELTGGRFKSFNSHVKSLALTRCLFEKDVSVGANLLWVEDCLFNGGNDVPLENRFWVQEQFEMRNSELVDNFQVTASPGATISLADNTFYGDVYVPDAPEDADISIRNNTLLGGRINSLPHIDQDYNYYGAAWYNEARMSGGWLNPYFVENDFPCASQGDIERCSLTEPRNLLPLRGAALAIGQEVMEQQTGGGAGFYEPESFTGHLRAGQDVAFSFRLSSYVEELAGASYELTYNGTAYTPKNSFTARVGTDDIAGGHYNAHNTLNFIVPAGAAGTNQWELWADFSGVSANIVTPAPAVQRMAYGGAVVQPDFARPLRIGVLELQLEVGYVLSNCTDTARSDTIQSIRNTLVSMLPLQDEELEIVDMGIYPFSGGWFSSWFSGTDIGRANQITTELEWFVGHYNSTGEAPLDFLVGVTPVGSLGGADGLSMALRRRAVLVDEMSPDAALHELGHSMGLYLNKEQYALPYAFAGDGFWTPPRGLQICGMAALNSSGKPSSVVPNGAIRHFPYLLFSRVYDVMGAANPQWIGAGTHEAMTRWLVGYLGLAGSGSKSSRLSDPQKKESGVTRIVHAAALISRGSDGDEMVGPSIKIEEVANSVADPSAIYSLNFRFDSFDAEGTLLSQEQCKTFISTIVTNTFWQQTFAVPTNAARYRMLRTPSLGQGGYSEIWNYQAYSSLSNSLQLTYHAPSENYLLTFTNSGGRRTVENRLLLSRDGGTNWIPLPLPAYTNEVWMPLTALPAGSPIFKLYSSDGIQTVVSDAVAAGSAAPSLPPSVQVLSPQNGMQGLTGMVWSLEANVYDPNGDLSAIHWISSLDGILGTNAVLPGVTLSEGTHRLDVVAADTGGLATTGSVTVTVGDLSTVDLSLSANDILMSPADNGLYNAIGYGTSNMLDVTVRNQGVSNLVEIQIFLTRPGEGESPVYSNLWSMSAFEKQAATISLDAPVRGDYQVRAVCTSVGIPDTNTANNEVIVLYTNQPPAVFGKRLSVLVEDLPLVIPLAATDPNLDSATFHLIPAAGASLSGGNTIIFDNGGTTGTFSVQFAASDVSLTSTPATVVIDVYGVDPATLPPVIISPTNHYATSGVPVHISILVDNGPCTFSAINLPSGLVLDENSGDINGTIIFASTYEFSVTAGNAIGSNTVFMNLFVAEAPPPPNDNFADAELLAGAPAMATGTTAGAGREPGEPQHAGTDSFKSVWYRWTAPSGGVAAVRGTGYTAGMAVYTGSALDALTEQSSLYGYDPLTCFLAEEGRQYFIAIETFTDTPFTFMLDYDLTPVLRAPRQISAVQSNPVDVTFTTWNPADVFSAAGLPDGLNLDPVSGHLSGAPTGYGNMMNANITTTNSFGSSTSSVSFTILSVNAPRFTSPLYASGIVGDGFTYNVGAENVTEGWLDVMFLPSGLLFNDVGRIISGTPEQHGFFMVYLSGYNTDTMEFADQELSLLIRPAYTNWSSDNELAGGADDDDDNDGATNFEEFIAGTDPNDPNDVLQARLSRQGSGFVLDWPSRTALCYNVQNSFSLSGGFSTVSNYVFSTPPTNILNFSTGGTSQFFRISVQE